MSIKLECLAKALKINTEFSQEDRQRIKDKRSIEVGIE